MLARGGLAFAASILLLGSCRPSAQAFDEGRRLSSRGQWVEAVEYYERALEQDPGNLEYRMALSRARLDASYSLLADARKKIEAGDRPGALFDYEAALELDPTNRYAREELLAARREIEEAETQSHVSVERGRLPFDRPVWVDPDSPEPLRLRFSEGMSLKAILEALARLGGVNVLFDEAFRDAPVDVELNDVTFWEALDLLALTNGFFYKVVDSSTVRLSTAPR